ncbi:putative LPS assembly protein LptD [Flavobacterium sp. NKUCC04_CG]|uniref:putative LPS assembly protein LptD n=1 Tax=Flavobacterium sp. NKUCC04_CG TaxID=2842121 RepID=UPI001D6AEC5F|nr:putative LPS assembly protein LptD [Flavobacterium sp. NKUCC04_CG]MBW3517966.1 LPS-assembly protein LptD [Flavobacterium sp. NKUCC04_CG]
MHTKIIHIVFLSFFIGAINTAVYSQDLKPKKQSLKVDKQPTNTTTTAPIPTDSIVSKKQDSLPKKAPMLEGIVYRKAKDYEKLDQKKKQLTLYNEAELNYLDFELKAGKIVYDFAKGEIYAGRLKDSLGNYSQNPIFKQGEDVIEPDSIRYNTKSRKAMVWNSRTSQSEFRIKAEISKKENDSVYFMQNVRFTTAKDIENPEYYFKTRKIKFVPNKKVVTGVTNMVIADVPTPIGLPFAFFPMSKKAESGFIIPTFGDTNLQGYYIQNGGYYFAISDKVDLNVLGDYYTNGSYALRGESSYAQRYKYNGRVNIRYENQIFSELGLPDYQRSTQYNIQWSHSQDQKSNPSSRFSASVNLGSGQYFTQSLNNNNIGSRLNNQMNSSITYSKTFESVPQVNMTLGATHSQTTGVESIINMSLPTLQLSVDRVYPFAKEGSAKKGFIKNINLSYNLRGENRVNTTEDKFFKSEMFNDLNTGFQHSIPISTNFKVLKHLSVSTGASYNEVWYMNTIEKQYDLGENKVIDRRVNGFDSFRTYNLNASIGTTIYGTFNFSKDSKLQAIRHLVTPKIGYTYSPSFEQYYDTYAIDATGTTMAEYTRFQQGIFGAPGKSFSNIMNLSLGNSFEAKIKDDESETGEPKKLMLLNSLNFSTSYNISADSLAWAPLQISASTNLFKDKMNINFGTTLDPYAIDNNGRKIDMFNIDNGGSLFRMTSANMTVNWSFASTDAIFGNEEKSDKQNVLNGGRADDLFGRSTDLGDNRQTLFDEDEDAADRPFTGFYNTKLPWDLVFAYSLTYGNSRRESEITNNSVMVSGNIEITPRWKFGFSTGYDFVQQGVTFTQLRFERDLMSWRMNFSWVPLGDYTSWGFFIGIKSSMLSDLKWEKKSVPDKRYRN